MAFFSRDGILLRSLLSTAIAFVLVAAITIAYTMVATDRQVRRESAVRLEQLLDTVESTLRVASFVKDQQLAKEVAAGLISNSEVLAVRITESGLPLAEMRRSRTGREDAPDPVLERDIFSPFKAGEVIGHVRLEADPNVIAARVRQDVLTTGLRLAWQLALIAAVVAATLLYVVIRPIRAMSERLHGMDPTAGERLTTPDGHAGTEIGRLVNDVNALAGRLVHALGEEHTLRLQRETDEKIYRAIFDNAESGIFMVGRDGHLASWNAAFARMLGLLGTKSQVRLDSFPWGDQAGVRQLVEQVFADGKPLSQAFPLAQSDGATLWFSLSLSPVSPEAAQGLVHDITSLKEAENQARRQAVTDPLTGLANRVGLEERIRTHIKRDLLEPGGGFALLLIDLDGFHLVNEGIGLPAGDEVLKNASARLSAIVRQEDTMARLTSDVFALVLDHPGDDGKVVAEMVARIPELLRQPYFIEGSPVRLTASIGIALFPNDGIDGPTLLRHAELAVDKAKAAGGNGYVFFDLTLSEAAEQRRHLENDFRQAVRNQQFTLFYQPVVDLQAGALVGAEALIRWRHPTRGLIPPERFIPLAEQTGLINDLGLWVLDTACAQVAAWKAAGTPYHVSINVSGRQIPDGMPPALVGEVLDRHGLDHNCLSLEITEGVLLDNVDLAQIWLEQVHAIGVAVHLDDFGTGYSSLSYLKRFRLETLKVDKSFVHDIQHDTGSRSLVEAIIAMAQSLGLRVVAEGVESPSHLPILRAMGCHFVQGFHLSRPMPAEDFSIAAERIARLLAPPAAEK